MERDLTRHCELSAWELRRSSWLPFTYAVRALPRRVAELIASLELPAGARVLDYGCGNMPYRPLFADGVELVGADLPGNPDAALDLADDGAIPAPDESFDAVLSTQVLEHVPDPDAYLSECFRVLRPGGRLVLSTHGIMIFHPAPEDNWRWTRTGLTSVVERAGFRVGRVEGVMGLAPTGLMLLHVAIDRRLPQPLRLAFAYPMQGLIGLADRLGRGGSADSWDAYVFALVAERP